MSTRRKFLKGAAVATGAAVGTAALGSAHIYAAEPKKITWRLQTYAGPALAEHVIKPSIEAFNKVARGEMEIQLYTADQLVPTGELFRAMQRGTIDAVQSDDDSIAAPVDVSVFGGYFPFASRYSLDIPVLFEQYGLRKIWEEAYSEVEGVTWLGAGAWDPCNFATVQPIRSLADLKGKRIFTFPTAGKFLTRFGVIPVTIPWEDVEVAVQTGELDGIAWCGITEYTTVDWANVTKYFLTNNISGAWIGSYFANSEKWEAVPEHLKTLFKLCMDSSHYYRQYWYWGGEAQIRVEGKKLELTTIPEAEWRTVEEEAKKFWDEIAQTSPRCKRVVEIFRKYNALMAEAGPPYRYS
ncbi:TRAP transporter substrate-binding protein [Zestomonas thermotolerans]|uniref:TRAP transporter substrate-binding protein n=1 Tax=Zestomonas thermotolerans TaxID=157784 RepID=UPI000484D1C6|nr:TRAP transporter substrate-binding protein [Pseudomonas thermotolerans]